MVECIKKHVTPVGTQMNDLAVLDGGLGDILQVRLREMRGVKKSETVKNTSKYETPFFFSRSNEWRISTIISGLHSGTNLIADRFAVTAVGFAGTVSE